MSHFSATVPYIYWGYSHVACVLKQGEMKKRGGRDTYMQDREKDMHSNTASTVSCIHVYTFAGLLGQVYLQLQPISSPQSPPFLEPLHFPGNPTRPTDEPTPHPVSRHYLKHSIQQSIYTHLSSKLFQQKYIHTRVQRLFLAYL